MTSESKKEQSSALKTTAVLGVAGVGGQRAALKQVEKGVSRQVTRADAKLYKKIYQSADIPIRTNPGFTAAYQGKTEAKLNTWLAENIERLGGLSNLPEELRSEAVLIGGKFRKPEILAHELGHSQIAKNKAGKLIQNVPTGLLAAVGSSTVGAGGVGYLTGKSDNKTVQSLGKWAPLIASAPELVYEGMASLLALKRMKTLGAGPSQMREAVKVLAPAWGTYLAKPIIGVAVAHAGSALAMHGKDKKASAGEETMKTYFPSFVDEVQKIALAVPAGAFSSAQPSRMHHFMEGAGEEAGPASGAVLGAGLAKAYGFDPIAGAAAGYGLGSVPSIVKTIVKRKVAQTKAADGYAVSQYSGPLSYGRFKQESRIPPFTAPPLQKSAAQQQGMAASGTQTMGPQLKFSPTKQLNSTRSIAQVEPTKPSANSAFKMGNSLPSIGSPL